MDLWTFLGYIFIFTVLVQIQCSVHTALADYLAIVFASIAYFRCILSDVYYSLLTYLPT